MVTMQKQLVSKIIMKKDEDIRGQWTLLSVIIKRIGNEEYLERLLTNRSQKTDYDTFGLERLYGDERADVC